MCLKVKKLRKKVFNFNEPINMFFNSYEMEEKVIFLVLCIASKVTEICLA